jgi:glycerate 2-kinase
MKIILAPDSLKESLTAVEVCRAMDLGIRRTLPNAEVISLPLADGGEGTVAALISATGGSLRTTSVIAPLGQPVKAHWGILGDGSTAVIEMAAAAGLALVPPEKRNPLFTTTFGVGQLISAALDASVSTILLGIGGSATTDCGLGMAQALGAVFYHHHSAIDTFMTGGQMGRVSRIDISGLDDRIRRTTIRVACDVDNPLLGPRGAAHVFAPQKGATPAEVNLLEANMQHVIALIEEISSPVRDLPGAGAAGGLGAGLTAFLGAKLVSGIDMVLDACSFNEHVRAADLIFTGEGKIDEQTLMGKTILGVLRRAKSAKVPVIALAGSALSGADKLYEHGLSSLFCICDRPMKLEESIQQAERLITQTTERAMRAFLAGKSSSNILV